MKDITKLQYSAGAVSKGFWFPEFKKYNQQLSQGLTDKEIKIKQQEENFLMAPSDAYGNKTINEVSKRTQELPEMIRTMFLNLSLSDQKLLNVLGLMMTDRLFFEYMYEVYREKIITGKFEFDNSDTRIFLENKSEQSEKVLSFKSYTKKRLAGAYRTYLKDANLLAEENGSSVIQKPILDINLEKEMKNQGLYPYLRVFLGE